MSEPKIAREVAETEVQAWVERFGSNLDPEARERIVRALMGGRVSFDDAAGAFTYRLLTPVELENKATLTELKIREPTTGQIRDANRATKDDFEQGIRLLSYISGQPLGVIDRLWQRDLMAAVTLVGFFG